MRHAEALRADAGGEPGLREILLGLDRRAVRTAGEQAIFQLAALVKFVGQQPSDQKQDHDHAERYECTALTAFFAVTVDHTVSLNRCSRFRQCSTSAQRGESFGSAMCLSLNLSAQKLSEALAL
jgi:hypothetical protein